MKIKTKNINPWTVIWVFVFILVVVACLTSCTNQKPVSQAPVYNITLTDNSQYIVGDNNVADTKNTTTTEQIARPNVEAKAENTTSYAWLIVLAITFIVITAIGGYYVYNKWIKK